MFEGSRWLLMQGFNIVYLYRFDVDSRAVAGTKEARTSDAIIMTCSAKDEVKIQKAKDLGLIHIHAELLPNIRQITVVVALPSEQNNTTTVTISSDSQSLSVAHGARFADLKLPAAVRHGFVPSIEAGSSRDVSLRLPIAHIPNGLDPLALDTASNALWSAPSMTPDTEVSCRICHASIVKETVNTWKDLPSENWAEMMDFWHCHKPDTDDAPEYGYSSSTKGYDAANSIGPTLGVALVDATCFHLLQADCNVQLGVNPAGRGVSAWFLLYLFGYDYDIDITIQA
ncbi:MAG: hypothetical protein L6R35_004048 [Caloplaca aegaea]|nr:MAG: hypothetical protein L6R35_004048 [Caloplaca aegaea]